MAVSPSHRFGQQVGMMMEAVVAPILKQFCETRGLALDSKHGRIVTQRGRKVTWQDRFGNAHDLDYVIVRPSKEHPEGSPLAFIEVAWRRYTKHSRNKAQEIQGALLPIAEKYAHDRPFLGAVLAGEFTAGSLAQMRSMGFTVLLFPYESIVAAYQSVGIDVRFDEQTPDDVFAKTIALIEKLSETQRQSVIERLVELNEKSIVMFENALHRAIDRRPMRIVIIPLFGSDHEFESIDAALEFVTSYDSKESGPLRKFDVIVSFTNGDRIEGVFSTQGEVVRFLQYVNR